MFLDNITSNVMMRITRKTLSEPETIVADPAVSQGSHAETISYIEDKWIGDMVPETTDNPVPQEVYETH